MSNKDDPGRDKSRSADTRSADTGQPKKPYATLDLKATEVKATEASPAAAKPETTDATKDAASKTATGGPAAGPATGTSTSGTTTSGASPTPTLATSAWTSASPAAKSADAGKTDAKIDPKAAAASASAATAAATATAKKPAPAVAGATPPPADKPAPRARGGFGSFVSHMAAGIVGGGLALFGGEQIMQGLGVPSDMLPGQGSAAVQQRISALETQFKGGTSSDLAQKLAASEKRIEEQGKSIAQLTDTSGALSTEAKALQEKLAQAADASARVARLEDTLATLSAAAAGDQPGRLPQLIAITTQLKQLEAALATQGAALRRDLTQTVETRTAQVAEAGEVAKSATQRIDRDMASVKTETARLTQRMEALKADGDRHAEGLRIVQEETGAIRSAVDGLKGDVESRLKSVARPTDVSAALAPVSSKLAALEQGLAGVVKSEDDRRSNAERIVLSLELGNLKRVLDRGQRYEAELAEVRKVAGTKVDLSALDKFKTQGVATTADLLRDFRPVAHAIIDTETEPADGNVVDRLLAGAKSIVRVRKVDHKPGDASAEAIVGRIELALKEGRLGNALDEAKTLSPRAATAARDWLEKVEARASVDKALVVLEGQLKSSLGAGKQAEAPAVTPAAGKAQN